MPWIEKTKSLPFDEQPPHGLFYFEGDVFFRHYDTLWMQNKKYPVITFPSGLQRELRNKPTGDILNIFGGFHLPRAGDHDAGFQHAITPQTLQALQHLHKPSRGSW